ncbi:DUF7286 family protein [Halapricum hydrolyticum]|uniref:Uncharacterized protein n=1 Tax=Halapricum hydrolyticum TaxID=2979991 RepID=A0AAE3IB37_9EURY|nr:hypothetical protein [Halapricum hydrolyticum]MCU4716507.1 hypothetical protein [Halapricum hydrolyticum]MCU4725888.1 hypothetical protein [Halapricum hydrolyticum]
MTNERPSTVTIAESDRGRIPFALIGVVLLATSSIAVVSLQTRTDPRADTDVATAFDRIETTTHVTLREAATTGLRDAAAAPVTETADTALGNAIKGGSADDTFRNYVRLRIYLAAREKLARTDQAVGNGVTASASLPPVEGGADSIEAALDRVEMSAGYYDSDLETGVVAVTIENVTLTVESDAGRETAQRTFELTVPTTVFEMHEKTQEYERRLNVGFFEPGFDGDRLYYGFGRKFAVRQYPVSWAKTYFDRFGPKKWDRAFEPIHDDRSTEILANLAAFDVQQATFGTADPAVDRIRRERMTCFALSTGYKVYDAVSKNGTTTSDVSDVGDVSEAALENATDASSDDGRIQVNEDTLCRATRYMMGNSEGGLGDPPSIRKMTEGFIKDKAGNVGGAVEIEVNPFADASYYGIRYGDRAESLTDLNNRDDISVDWPPGETDPEGDDAWSDVKDNVDGSGEDSEDLLSGMELDPDTRFDEVIGHVYDVEVDVSEDVSRDGPRPWAPEPPGDNWTEVESERRYEVVDADDVEVTTERGPDTNIEGDRWSDLRNVAATIENELKHVRKWRRMEGNGQNVRVNTTTTTATRNVTFESDVDIDAKHSQRTQVDDLGTEHVYESGGEAGPEDVPNFERVPQRSLSKVFGVELSTEDELEAKLDDKIDTGSIVSEDRMGEAVTSRTDTFEPDVLEEAERETLETWIEDEVDDVRATVKDEIPPVEVGPTTFVDGEPILDGLRENISDMKSRLVYGDGPGGPYENPKAKVRAEATKVYLDNVFEWTSRFDDKATDTKNTAQDEVMAPLDVADGEIAEVVSFAQRVIAGDVDMAGDADFEGSPLYDDVKFTIDASPAYLESATVNRTELPAVRASGDGFTDLDDGVEHGPMVTKYDNVFLPRSGAPLVPWPGFWYATLSTWGLQIDGEYARFELRADVSDPSTSEPVRYIRDDREVAVELADGAMTAGSVTPIDFRSDTVVAVIVPSYTKAATGKPGIGDPWGKRYGCAGPYPETGPEPDEDSCNWITD